MENKQIYTVKEVADLLGISRIAVFGRIKRGSLKAEKIGRNYVIHRRNLPSMISAPLTQKDKEIIDKGVERVLDEYGETMRLLGKE